MQHCIGWFVLIVLSHLTGYPELALINVFVRESLRLRYICDIYLSLDVSECWNKAQNCPAHRITLLVVCIFLEKFLLEI